MLVPVLLKALAWTGLAVAVVGGGAILAFVVGFMRSPEYRQRHHIGWPR